MSEHTLTFGVQYGHQPHPFFGYCPQLRTGYGIVHAPDYRQARALVHAAFGPAWSMLHMGGEDAQRARTPLWDEHFPDGALFTLRPDPVGQPVLTFHITTPPITRTTTVQIQGAS